MPHLEFVFVGRSLTGDWCLVGSDNTTRIDATRRETVKNGNSLPQAQKNSGPKWCIDILGGTQETKGEATASPGGGGSRGNGRLHLWFLKGRYTKVKPNLNRKPR